jgi:hypothetical protein
VTSASARSRRGLSRPLTHKRPSLIPDHPVQYAIEGKVAGNDLELAAALDRIARAAKGARF